MKFPRHALAALGLIAPACSPAPAHRASAPQTPAASVPPADVAGSAGPGADEDRASSPGPASTTTEAPATTVTVTVPATTSTTRRATTTTFVLPETEAPDEFDARDASTARVSWYGAESGSHTANGDRYDPSGLTFAHLSMRFGTRVRFCGPLGCVVATCTDRGPAAWTGKTFDLSRGAFALVAPLSAGVATVTWEVVA